MSRHVVVHNHFPSRRARVKVRDVNLNEVEREAVKKKIVEAVSRGDWEEERRLRTLLGEAGRLTKGSYGRDAGEAQVAGYRMAMNGWRQSAVEAAIIAKGMNAAAAEELWNGYRAAQAKLGKTGRRDAKRPPSFKVGDVVTLIGNGYDVPAGSKVKIVSVDDYGDRYLFDVRDLWTGEEAENVMELELSK